MCGFYDNKQRIKKEDVAYYKDNPVTIVSVTHIKHNKTMDIVIKYNDNHIETINIPYKSTGYGFTI
jgi:hypothetical protein